MYILEHFDISALSLSICYVNGGVPTDVKQIDLRTFLPQHPARAGMKLRPAECSGIVAMVRALKPLSYIENSAQGA